jgi:geranylgeranyl pyrophosphate synthase
MNTGEIIDRLAERPDLPVEALRAASADRASAVPIFLDAIEEFVTPGGKPIPPDALFLVFHLLGEWRETSAYRPLARLLRRPRDELNEVLGDA